ncbi:MAG: TrlF family AAA-like ATPase [Pseudomonadota bacterium]
MKFAGSNWWSFDFHNHTPSSGDYNDVERGQITPRDWLLAHMRAETDCVAITDHNSGGWIDRLKHELSAMANEQPRHAEFREIYLFPGVEITTSEGLHVLAVFGPEDGEAKIHGVLALAHYNDHANNHEGMCDAGASAICDHIHQMGGVVVLAHAEEVNGIFHGTISASGQFIPTRPDRSVEQLLEKADAIEIHDESSQAIRHFSAKLTGRAIVDGSDSHRLSSAGYRRVWLKMAKPSIEGLKLALLDPTSSLLRQASPPPAPANRITSLKVEQLLLRRQVLEVNFSPWFNSIIGGRGSGKSTLLESLRLAMARESDVEELGSDSDVLRAFNRFKQVGGVRGNSGMVRPETVLAATVEKKDESSSSIERYLLTWRHTGFSAQRLDENGNWEDTGMTAAQAASMFPVKVFSQKQIFELAERPSALLGYIDGSPEVAFQAWFERNEELRRALRALRSEERQLHQSIAKKAQLETELKEVSRKATAYQQSVVAQQVTTFRENQKARQTINSFVEAIAAPLHALEAVAGQQNPYDSVQIENIDLKHPNPAAVQLAANALVGDLRSQYAALQQAINVLRQHVEAFSALPAVSEFLSDLDGAMAAYRQEVERLKAEGIGTAHEAEAALRRKQELEAALGDIAAQEQQLARTQQNTLHAYAALKLHRRKLTRRRQDFVKSVLSGNTNLRINIEGQADARHSVESFRSVLRLQDGAFLDEVLSIEETSGQADGLLGRLIGDRIHDPTHKRVTSLKLGILERSSNILGQAVHGKLVTALRRLNQDDDDALLEWFPDDLVTVEFRRPDSHNFQSLERASAGQKTSAILSFLLAHGDEPLLLDQPEDDLDNALVSELVVQQIRGNKSRRQIIVVTHNPNIVVNGDAELVLPMAFAGGQIQLNDAGGLQERAVRQRICDIMEGGRDAFRQRYKRILEDLDASR